MNTSGCFPVRLHNEWNGQLLEAYDRETGRWKGYWYATDADSGQLNGFASHMKEVFLNSCKQGPTTSAENFNSSFIGGFNVKESGEKSPTPAPVVVTSPTVFVNNGKRWRDAKRTGDIVVAPYQRVQALLAFENGGIRTEISTQNHRISCHQIARVLGISAITHPVIGLCYDFGGEFLCSYHGDVYVTYAQSSVFSDDLTAYEEGFTIEPFQSFLSRPQDFYVELAERISEVMAEANKASLDILTATAELPQTVKSIYDGLKTIVRLCADVRKKQFSLLNKAKRVRTEYERKVFRLEFSSREQYLKARNERSRRIISAKLARDKKQLKKDMERTEKTFLDAVASVWLNARYNIGPAIWTIEDYLTAMLEKEKLFFRFRDRLIREIDGPSVQGFSQSGNIQLTQRVFVKRGFLPGQTGWQHFSADIFATAWELIPLSFVIDWVVNIGDFIRTRASSTLEQAYTEGSTISLKFEGQVIYTGKHNSRVTADFSGYSRSNFTTSDYCRLTISPKIDVVRQLDALALSWNIFFKKAWRV